MRIQVNGYDSHRTYGGVLLTIFLLATATFITYFFGRDVLERKQPEVASLEEYVNDPEPIYFSPKENPLMIGIMDGVTWEYFNDPSYFYADVSVNECSVKEIDGVKTIEVVSEVHKAVPCTKDHFQIPDLEAYLQYIDISKFLCMDYDAF